MTHSATPNAATDPDESSSKLSKVDRELLRRIYDRPEYTVVVRAIGGLTWRIEDARDLVVPLMKRFGVAKVFQATHELLAIDTRRSKLTARLTDEVRRYAVQLLGMPKDSDDVTMPKSGESPRERLRRLRLVDDTSAVADDYIPVNRQRSRVVESYESRLQTDDVSFRHAKDVEFLSTAKRPAVKVDFVVKRGAERQLTLVRRELTATIRQRLVKLLQRLGQDYVAVRVWPIGFDKNWLWEKEWVLPDESDNSARTESGETVVAPDVFVTVAVPATSSVSSLPLVQRELF